MPEKVIRVKSVVYIPELVCGFFHIVPPAFFIKNREDHAARGVDLQIQKKWPLSKGAI